MTVEVTDDRSDRRRHADGGRRVLKGQEGGEMFCPKQGASWTSAFQPELKGFLIMLMEIGGDEMQACGHL